MTESASPPPAAEPGPDAWNFSKMVPGMEFMQQWAKSAGAAMPSIGQWVAPTLDPAELDKRINELRTVHFWLEQNARMLAMSIQALEVQRMTLNTLQGMNVPIDKLRDSLKTAAAHNASAAATGGTNPPPAASSPFTAAFAAPFATPFATPFTAPPAGAPPAGASAAAGPTAAANAQPQAAGGAGQAAADPMRWWGALTQQFTQLAAHAMQDALKAGPAPSPAAAASTEPQPSAPPPSAADDAAPPGAAATGASNPVKGGSKRAPPRS